MITLLQYGSQEPSTLGIMGGYHEGLKNRLMHDDHMSSCTMYLCMAVIILFSAPET